MIRRTQHQQKIYVKSFNIGFRKDIHLELHLVTTYWLLFIPIYRNKKLIHSNIKIT